MSGPRIYIAGLGIITPLGTGLQATEQALRANLSAIHPLELFPLLNSSPLPVGEVREKLPDYSLPRTHTLALVAAEQAMENWGRPPDAVILGTTTGGILTTEALLNDKETRPELYRYHGLGSVAGEVARHQDCHGPVITVSTACSSGAAAIKIALEMLRQGKAGSVLAGGVDSLCRLTYFGFHSLQLVDKDGSRPLDKNRHGMSVAEGAALLLLTTEKTADPLAEIMGGGLSCDAYHPAAPHPQGRGALEAMTQAINDAGISRDDIGYISLHGTGTPDNDLAESRAINTLFSGPPPLSSIKGATGHSLAAAGAIETVISALAVSRSFLPANSRLLEPDPELNLRPLAVPLERQVAAVLSNSFGFGGNNAALVIAGPDKFPPPPARTKKGPLTIIGRACLSGAGSRAETMAALCQGKPVAGTLALPEISSNLPSREVRRLKRLARMALSLATAAHEDSGREVSPCSVFMGTGWGALSETCDFLTRLTETGEQFPSPTDFIGSVHNGPAGQVAMKFQATGPNITTSGGDYSFEQALMTAALLTAGDESLFVLATDEGHSRFSPLFDPSVRPDHNLADGGGAFCLTRAPKDKGPTIRVSFFRDSMAPDIMDSLVKALGGAEKTRAEYGLIMAGIPAAHREQGQKQLAGFVDRTGFNAPVIDYRKMTGEFAAASALAAVMAVDLLIRGEAPAALTGGDRLRLEPKGVLLLGLGRFVTAMEIKKPNSYSSGPIQHS